MAGAALPAIAAPPSVAEPLVREQRSVAVLGASETWRLVWDAKPATACGPDEVFMAVTCPCSGWAYAEQGKLSLVRRRGGRDIERMDLGPLFGKFDAPAADQADGSAYLQRWPLKSGDMERETRGDRNLVAEIKRRPPPVIMKFADYDRDGAATEFLLQVGTLPCGKHQFAAIGVTASAHQLHALTSAAHPNAPLIMPWEAWQALLKGSGPTAVPSWTCGDHGSETRSELVVSANSGGIRVKAREFSCPASGETEKLIQETEQ